jgi:sec-independent protein translocase protein TatA
VPFGVGFPELIILLLVLLLVFGAKRLPEMGRSLGKGMREFKDGVSGMEATVTGTEPSPPAQLPAAQSSSPSSSSPGASAPSAAQVQRDLESLSQEERDAIAQSLASSPERSSAQESERETVS